MKSTVLLVATTTRWVGTARILRPLAAAGFDVALLTPKNSLAEASRYLGKVGHLPDDVTPMQWVHAFAGMVKATSPRLVVPCDDMGFRLLQMLALQPPEELRPAVKLELGVLIRDSLGDPAHYRASVEKTLLPPAAAALGIRVPAHKVIATLADAEAFTAAHGYPVVLKRNYSTAGAGVEIVDTREQLAPSFAALTRPEQSALVDPAAAQLLIQERIPGDIHYENTAAWQGTRIGGFAVERLQYAELKGPAAVVRCYHSAEISDFSSKLVRGFGMTGLFATEFVVHRDTGHAYLLEINRRTDAGHAHRVRASMSISARHCTRCCMAPHPPTRREMDPGDEWVNVHFPQEWLRDPESPYLRDYPVDVPWDEPELIEAMLAMRHE